MANKNPPGYIPLTLHSTGGLELDYFNSQKPRQGGGQQRGPRSGGGGGQHGGGGGKRRRHGKGGGQQRHEGHRHEGGRQRFAGSRRDHSPHNQNGEFESEAGAEDAVEASAAPDVAEDTNFGGEEE